MCKIRVIFKTDKDRIVKDEIYQFENLEISPIDRPAYVTCLFENETVKMYSYFINEAEDFCDFKLDEKLEFTYGKLSGRIKRLIVSNTKIYDTTLFRIMQQLSDNLSIRVSNNVKEYLRLYGFILDILQSSLTYKKEEFSQELEMIEQ